MKRIQHLFLYIALFGLSCGLYAQDKDVCNAFFPYVEGATFTYENYNKRDKLESSETYEVQSLEETSEGLKATIATDLDDKKGKDINSGTFIVRCKDGVYYIRVDEIMSQEMMDAFESTEVEVKGDFLSYPGAIAVGDVLKGGTTTITAKTGGMNIMKMDVQISDRKVEAKESVTTPAGTFDCFRISYTTSVDFLFNKEYKSVDWMAEDVGMVQSYTYKNGDKLIGKRKLVSYEQ